MACSIASPSVVYVPPAPITITNNNTNTNNNNSTPTGGPAYTYPNYYPTYTNPTYIYPTYTYPTTTINQPTVTTNSATNITFANATLNGSVNGNGIFTTAWFEYGTNANFGYSTPRVSYGTGFTNLNANITGLSANILYYFRTVAQSTQGGIIYGNTLSFSTITGFVNNRPTVVLYADQASVAYNGTATVRWITTNAASCYASGGSTGWAGTKSIGPGSFYTGSLTGNRTYAITCSNSFGSANDSATVTVRGQTTVNPTPAPTSLVLITSSVDRNQPIVPTIDNTRPRPGDEINYTVGYQNIGTGAITNLVLRIDLPYEADYLSSNPNNPTRSGQTFVFNLGTLRANGEGATTIKTRVRENIPAGTNLNFPAILSYTDPSNQPQSVSANVSAQVWSEPENIVTPVNVNENENTSLGANVFGAGFLPTNLFGWLLLLVLILILVLLARYLFSPNQPFPFRKKTTTTTIQQ